MKDGIDFMGFFFSSSPAFSYTFTETGTYSFSFQLPEDQGGGSPVNCTLEAVQGVESITLSSDSYALQTGDTVIVVPTLRPDNAPDRTVLYDSSDPNIASVDENGCITALSAGTCSIIVTARGGVNVWREISISVTERPFGFTGISANYHFAPPDDPEGPTYGEIGESADFTIDYYPAGESTVLICMNVYRDGALFDASGWMENQNAFSFSFPQRGSYAVEFTMRSPSGDKQATERVSDNIVIRPAPTGITLPFEDWTLSYGEVAFLPSVTVEPAGANPHVSWAVSIGNAAYISTSLEDVALVAQAEGECVLTCSSDVNPSIRATVRVAVKPLQEIRANGEPLESTLQVGVPFDFTGNVYGPSVTGASYIIELRSTGLDLIASGQDLSWTFEGPGAYVLWLRVQKRDGSENLVSYNVDIVGPDIQYAVDELVLSAGSGVNSISLADGFMRWVGDYGLQYEKLLWQSANTAVASVDGNGYIHAGRPGSTTVTLDYYGFKYTLNVRVVSEMNILRIPEGTTEIQSEAFRGAAADIVVLPAGLERIDRNAFSHMDSLKYVIFARGNIQCDIASDAFAPDHHILASYYAEEDWDSWDQYIDDHYPVWSYMSTASWTID